MKEQKIVTVTADPCNDLCDLPLPLSLLNSNLPLIPACSAGERQPRGCGHVRALREHRRLGDVDLAAHVPHLQHRLLADLPGIKYQIP